MGKSSDQFYFKLQTSTLSLGNEDAYLWIYSLTETFDKDRVVWNGRIVFDEEYVYLFFLNEDPEKCDLYSEFSSKEDLISAIIAYIDHIIKKGNK